MAKRYMFTVDGTELAWNALPDDVATMSANAQKIINDQGVGWRSCRDLFEQIFESAGKCIDDYWLGVCLRRYDIPTALKTILASNKYKISCANMCLFIMLPYTRADTMIMRCCHHEGCDHMLGGIADDRLRDLMICVDVADVLQMIVACDSTGNRSECCHSICSHFINMLTHTTNKHIVSIVTLDTPEAMTPQGIFISTSRTNITFSRQNTNIFNYYNTLQKLCYLACHKWKIDIRFRHLLEARGDLFMFY